MKKTLGTIVQNKQFDALVAFVLFVVIALGLDYATDSSFGVLTVLADIGLSLAAAAIVYLESGKRPRSLTVIKRRSEHFAVAGKLAIGLLLFILFLVLYITN